MQPITRSLRYQPSWPTTIFQYRLTGEEDTQLIYPLIGTRSRPTFGACFLPCGQSPCKYSSQFSFHISSHQTRTTINNAATNDLANVGFNGDILISNPPPTFTNVHVRTRTFGSSPTEPG